MVLIKNQFEPQNEYELEIKQASFFGLSSIILYILFYWLNQKKVFVYVTYFEIKRLFKYEKYFYDDIKTYFSECKKSKHSTWTEYYLITKNDDKITFVDSEYSNFHSFFYKIERKIKKDIKINNTFTKPKFLKYSVYCGIFSFLFFYFSSFFYDFNQIKNNDFTFFKSKLNNIQIKETNKGKQYFELELANYPMFKFKIAENNIVNRDVFLITFKASSVIIIGVSKEDFEKKIAKIKPLGFLDKYLHFSSISVRQVKDLENNFYVKLDKDNKLKTSNNYSAIGLFTFFGLLFLYLSLGNYRAYRNQAILEK